MEFKTISIFCDFYEVKKLDLAKYFLNNRTLRELTNE
jgi:hypothetical protein